MKAKNPFSRSEATLARIESAFRAGGMTTDELAETVFLSRFWAWEYIKHLKAAKKIHISKWITVKKGKTVHLPVYAWGEGIDARAPRKKTNAQRLKERRRDPEVRMQESQRAKLRKIQPKRDWAAAWIQPREAA